MSRTIKKPSYDRATVKPGIVHIGVGNFHRAHLEDYLNALFGKDVSQKG